MNLLVARFRDQGPRALRVFILAFLAGFLLYLDRPGHVGALPIPVFVGMVYAGLITPTAVLTAVLLPGLTKLSDAVQVARLGFAASVALFPAVMRPLAEEPVINATVVILGGMALVSVTRWMARENLGVAANA